MDIALFFLIPGLFVLVFDSRIADAENRFLGELSKYIPAHLKWPNAVPPGSKACFENLRFFFRWLGASMTLCGIGLGICWLLAS